MNVQDFVEKVVREVRAGAKAALGEELASVRAVLDLTLSVWRGDDREAIEVLRDTPQTAHVEVDSWGMAEEQPMGTLEPMQEPDADCARAAAERRAMTDREQDAIGAEEGLQMKPRGPGTSLYAAAAERARRTAIETVAMEAARELCGVLDAAIEPVTVADCAVMVRLLYRHERVMRGLPDIADELAMEHLGLASPEPEVSTDEDLLQRLPAMFRKANGEPPTDADCARLVRLLRKPRSNP